MKLRIHHRTRYRFDQPVFLEPHVIRLRPRLDATVWAHELALDIDPRPAVRAENLDLEGNTVSEGWFSEATDHLTIESRAFVETLVTDPFRFLLEDPETTLPYAYTTTMGTRLHAYRQAPDRAPVAVRELALEAAEDVARRQDRFPLALATRIHREFSVEARAEGAPHPAETTVEAGRGSCRDLAVLFMECCRSMGLAARFVSGYVHVDDDTHPELHAWAETYHQGGGWRGYDPTLGLAAADRHVAVAAAAEPSDAAPVSGSFRGSATATLETAVEIAVDPSS